MSNPIFSVFSNNPHVDSWVATGLSPNQNLESVFDVPNVFGLDNVTLRDALSFNGGQTLKDAAKLLLKQAVAGVLNAAHPNVDYITTVSSILNTVNNALTSNNRNTMLNLASNLDSKNNLGCPLN